MTVSCFARKSLIVTNLDAGSSFVLIIFAMLVHIYWVLSFMSCRDRFGWTAELAAGVDHGAVGEKLLH